MSLTVAKEAGGTAFLGVDTHLAAHATVALDGLGRYLRTASFPATAAGYANLLRWAERLAIRISPAS